MGCCVFFCFGVCFRFAVSSLCFVYGVNRLFRKLIGRIVIFYPCEIALYENQLGNDAFKLIPRKSGNVLFARYAVLLG